MTDGRHNIDSRRILYSLCRGMGALLLALLLVPWAHAESTQRPFCRFSLDDREWSNTGPQEYIARRANPRNDASGVPQVVREINRSLSIAPDFDIVILEGDDNAFATVASGRRILAIDVGFLDRLNREVGTEWGAISVIAHEVGHHIDGLSQGNPLRRELNADYWSGQVLQRLGSSARAAISTILEIGTDDDTDTHPSKWARAEKIKQGWTDASEGRIDYSHCMNCR